MQLQDCSPTSNLQAKHTKQPPYSQPNFLGHTYTHTHFLCTHTHANQHASCHTTAPISFPVVGLTREHRHPGTGSCVQQASHNTSLDDPSPTSKHTPSRRPVTRVRRPSHTDPKPASHQGASSLTQQTPSHRPAVTRARRPSHTGPCSAPAPAPAQPHPGPQ